MDKLVNVKRWISALWKSLVELIVCVIKSIGDIIRAILINIREIVVELIVLFKTILLPVASKEFKIVVDRLFVLFVLGALLFLGWSKLITFLR